ncbi:MAG: hypothetical protein ACR2KP_11890 [Egibacteraceae bacterium]
MSKPSLLCGGQEPGVAVTGRDHVAIEDARDELVAAGEPVVRTAAVAVGRQVLQITGRQRVHPPVEGRVELLSALHGVPAEQQAAGHDEHQRDRDDSGGGHARPQRTEHRYPRSTKPTPRTVCSSRGPCASVLRRR